MAPKKGISRLKQEEQWAAKLGSKALNPLQVFDVQDALRQGLERYPVQGRMFTFTYKDDGTVFYQDEERRVPCGYLRLERFLQDV